MAMAQEYHRNKFISFEQFSSTKGAPMIFGGRLALYNKIEAFDGPKSSNAFNFDSLLFLGT